MGELNLAYETKQQQLYIAACLAAFMHSLGSKCTWVSGAWAKVNYLADGNAWRENDQTVHLRGGDSIKFSAFFADDSDIEYSKPVLLTDIEEAVDEQTKIFDNSKGDNPFKLTYAEAVALENNVSHTLDQSIDVGVTIEASAKEKVGTEFTGAEFEEKISASLGIHLDNSTTTAESKSQSQSVDIELDVPAGEIKMIKIVKDHARTKSSYTIRGVLDMSMQMNFSKGFPRPISLTSFDQLHQAVIEGKDTDYPELEHYWNGDKRCVSRVRNGISRLFSEDRHINMTGSKIRVYEKNADYTVIDLDTPEHEGVKTFDMTKQEDLDQVRQFAEVE